MNIQRVTQRHHVETEIVVAGGGLSGVACAVAAARQGRKVALVQDRPVLGGNASSEVRMHIVGANGSRPMAEGTLETRESGFIEELRLELSMRNVQRSPSIFDHILYEKVKAEPNITLYFNTSVVGAVVEGGRISSVLATRQSTEDEFLFSAKIFIDCTGDGGLGVAAGAEFMEGREPKSAFGESLAPEEGDKERLGSTLLFMARKYDRPMPFIAPPWARKFTEEDLKHRMHARPGQNGHLEYGYWWLEWGGHLDTIKDNEAIRDHLHAVVMGIWDHLKNGGDHGADNWALEWYGVLPGKRESRRFVGQHVLTEDDVMQSHPQPDAIAYGGWPIDLHPTRGIDAVEESPCIQHTVPHLYDIPLRSCVSRNVRNLMFAGRNASATHVAFASTRVMATCAAMGEGVGVAASVAIGRGLEPAALAADAAVVTEIQNRLLAQDVFLIGRRDPHCGNLALQGRIAASSEQEDGRAGEVLSGMTRSVTDTERGVKADRVVPGWHRWKSRPEAGFPASLEVAWPAPVEVESVEFVFDTGLHRFLTFTQADGYHELFIWGVGQPEVIRDYHVEIKKDGEWKRLESVRDNWQRRRRHALAPAGERVAVDAVRLVADAAWGIDHARLFKVTVF